MHDRIRTRLDTWFGHLISAADVSRLAGFFAGPAISAVLSFMIVPLTTWMVATEEYGRISMFTMGLTIGALASTLGLDQSFAREFHASDAKQNLFRRCAALPLTTAGVLCALLILGHSVFDLWLWGEPNLAATTLLAVCLYFTILERYSGLAIRMEERAWLYSGLLITNQALRLGLILLLLNLMPRTYTTIMLATTLAMVTTGLIRIVASRAYWFGSWRGALDRQALKPLLRYGLPLLPAALLMWALNSMDKLALRMWGTYSDLGVYSAGFKLVAALDIVNQGFATFWWPTCFRWYESGSPKARFDHVATWVAVLAAGLAAVLVLGRDVIVLLLGPEYRAASALAPFLVFVPLMYLLSEVSGAGINLTRKSEYNVVSTGVAALTNLVGNWLLVPRYGALGAAISSGISYTIFMVTKSALGNRLWDKSWGSPWVYGLTAGMLALAFTTLL